MSLLKIRNSNGDFEPAQILDIESMVGGGYEYSTEEKVVGKWTNGKPLYRKYISATSPSSNNQATNIVSVTDLSIDEFVKIEGIMYSQDGKLGEYRLPFYISATANCNIWYAKNENSIRSNQSGYSSKKIFIIIEYTKTTDAENSFTLDMLTTGDIDVTATDTDVEEVFG